MAIEMPAPRSKPTPRGRGRASTSSARGAPISTRDIRVAPADGARPRMKVSGLAVVANARSRCEIRTAQRPAKFRAIPYGRLRMWLTVAPVAPVLGSARSAPSRLSDTLDRTKHERAPPGRTALGQGTRCGAALDRLTTSQRCSQSMQQPRGPGPPGFPVGDRPKLPATAYQG